MRNMIPTLIAALALAAAVLPSCSKGGSSGDDDDDSTAKTATPAKAKALTGKLSAAAWTYASARAIPTVDDDAAQPYTITIIGDKIDAPCQQSVYQAADRKSIEFLARIDKPAEAALDAAAKFKFIDESGSDAVKLDPASATFKVDSVGTASVKAHLTAAANDDNSVSGAFTIAKCCPNDDGNAYVACTAN